MRGGLIVFASLLAAGTAVAQGPGNPSFNLVNRGDQPIEQAYATPVGNDRWGQDRLTRYNLPPGQTFPLRLPADGNCLYDIRVIYADGKPEERRRVDTCRVAAIAFGAAPGAGTRIQAPPDDPSFRIVNRGRFELESVFVSPSGDDRWGEDRLGDDTLSAGATRVIHLSPGTCRYDIRVVFANGEATERRRLDLCSITDLRVP